MPLLYSELASVVQYMLVKGYSNLLFSRHRESWQNVGQILDSKANLNSYCNEVAKQLQIAYRPPHLPVDLRFLDGPGAHSRAPSEKMDMEARQEEFRMLMSRYKYSE